MTAKAFNTYKGLLHELAALGNESAEADDVRERMDPVWLQLDEGEKKAARHYSAKLYEGPFFVCPKCDTESFNPNDGINRYCGACNEFFPEQQE